MKCPNCRFWNDGIATMVKITDKEGLPVAPSTNYVCRRCGTRYDNKGMVKR